MSILTSVERKSRQGRIFLAGVTLATVLGSVTMLYPFLLMLSGSLCSSMDISRMDLVPAFLSDDAMLVRKFLETKYNFDPTEMNRHRRTRDYNFETAWVPGRVNTRAVEDLEEFLSQPSIPDHWHILGGTRLIRRMQSDTLAELQQRVRAYYNDDLSALSRDIGIALVSWWQLEVLPPKWAHRRFDFTPSPVFDQYFQLLRELPVANRAPVSLTGEFMEAVIYPAYGMTDVEEYNRGHARDLDTYASFALPRRSPGPDEPALREEWLAFVLGHCHPSFVRADVSAEQYQAFLRERFGTMERLRRQWTRHDATSFDEIELPGEREWLFAEEAGVYRDFLARLAPEQLYLVGPEFAWRDWLRKRFPTLHEVNTAHASRAGSWREVSMPLPQLETRHVDEHSGSLRWRFATKNFRIAFLQVFVQGRPFYNTIIYVALTLLFALTIQPLAAYALSRFNPPGMWKIIFIFMATMAFPPMVGTLPTFLIMKKLNLLNTFIALVLPMVVNGFLIFLLKGFFDSIPQHLYEAAMIEGASELRMFWYVTMALSKPILAVVALGAFNSAWMSFMYPLIVCPDESMHVLAVWLHQFQARAPTSAVFASILVASIPTLLVFAFTQGTIMKGIAVPAEK